MWGINRVKREQKTKNSQFGETNDRTRIEQCLTFLK